MDENKTPATAESASTSNDRPVIQVVLIEDSDEDGDSDTGLIQELLDRAGPIRFEVRRESLVSRELLSTPVTGADVVLLNLNLPGSEGLDTVARVMKIAGGAPVVVLSSVEDRVVAVATLELGAQDYLCKKQVTADGLYHSIRQAIKRKEKEVQFALAREELQRQVQARTRDLDATNRLLRSLIDNSPDLIYAKDLRGRFLVANIAAAKHMGASSPAELLGKSDFDFHPEELSVRFYADEQAIFRTGEAVIDKEEPAGNDSERWISTTKAPLRDGQGRIEGLVGIGREITERKRAEERHRLVIESAPNAMVMVDRRGKIRLVNRQTEKWFGYTREELLGQPIEILVPERFRNMHPQHRQHYVSAAKAAPRQMGVGRDLHGVRKDGSEFPVEIGLNPIESPEGPMVLSAFTDITERKRAEAELAKAHAGLELRVQERTAELARSVEQLASANQELDAFVHISSHDLQEPVRNLISYSTLLRQDLGEDLSKDAEEDLHYITEAAKRMQRLVRDLLELSRSGRAAMKHEPVRLDDCVDESLEALRVRLEESGARVQRGPLPEVTGDRTLLTQLYQNLLGNAMKFSSGGQPVINLTAEQTGGFWQLGVRDNGIGLNPEYADQIFAPFKRLHGQTEYEGSGIGLAICRKAVECHGGKIWVESDLGNGAHFKFTLPATAPAQE